MFDSTIALLPFAFIICGCTVINCLLVVKCRGNVKKTQDCKVSSLDEKGDEGRSDASNSGCMISYSPIRQDSKSSVVYALNAISKEAGFTKREAEVFSCLYRGWSSKQIEEKLFISCTTVKTHTYHIYQKLNVHSKQEIINLVDCFQAQEKRSA